MSQPFKICPQCQTSTDIHAQTCGGCGRQFRTQFAQSTDQTVLGAASPPPSYQPPVQSGAYPQPYQQPAPPVYQPPPVYIQSSRRTDPCAVISVIFGTLGLLLFCCMGWIFSLVGGVLALVSLIRIHVDASLDGKVLAWIGILLAAIPMLIWFALIVIGSMS